MKIENQVKIWDKIAGPWKRFRVKPVEEVTQFLKGKKGNILDLGCGSGRNFTKVDGVIYGIDFSEEMLKFAEEHAGREGFNVKTIKSPAYDLPFENNFFDAAIFITVLHCIPESKKRKEALKELFRVLKPHSEALITVWNKNQERFRDSEKEIIIPWKDNGEGHMRYYYLYDEKEILDLLKKTGFEIIKSGNIENVHGNSKKNIIAIVQKP
jgi:ubiquinone/menaquinone biosynthesis C-methylase UbiE